MNGATLSSEPMARLFTVPSPNIPSRLSHHIRLWTDFYLFLLRHKHIKSSESEKDRLALSVYVRLAFTYICCMLWRGRVQIGGGGIYGKSVCIVTCPSLIDFSCFNEIRNSCIVVRGSVYFFFFFLFFGLCFGALHILLAWFGFGRNAAEMSFPILRSTKLGRIFDFLAELTWSELKFQGNELFWSQLLRSCADWKKRRRFYRINIQFASVLNDLFLKYEHFDGWWESYYQLS